MKSHGVVRKTEKRAGKREWIRVIVASNDVTGLDPQFVRTECASRASSAGPEMTKKDEEEEERRGGPQLPPWLPTQ